MFYLFHWFRIYNTPCKYPPHIFEHFVQCCSQLFEQTNRSISLIFDRVQLIKKSQKGKSSTIVSSANLWYLREILLPGCLTCMVSYFTIYTIWEISHSRYLLPFSLVSYLQSTLQISSAYFRTLCTVLLAIIRTNK